MRAKGEHCGLEYDTIFLAQLLQLFFPPVGTLLLRSKGRRSQPPPVGSDGGGVLSVTRIILIRVQAIALAYDPRVYHRHPEPTNGRLICYGYDIIWLWLGDVDLITGWYGPALINNSVHHPWRSCLTRGDDSIISEIQNGEYQKRS